jgi:acyl dehydratase
VTDRYFEDYVPGVTYECGSVAVTEDEIVEFARRYDPQDFHTDPAAAAAGPFGGLIASGWHTASLMMRPRPVRPGAVLRLRATVTEARHSRSKLDRGLVRTRVELVDDGGEVVFSASLLNFILVRPG